MSIGLGVIQQTRAAFSLTRTLGRILDQSDQSIDLDELHAALGLGLLIAVPLDRAETRRWSAYARDAFLETTAQCYGATVRPIHPPAAAHGLSGRVEFRQHFQASYAPLVRRAIEHGQFVLSWGGWTEPYDSDWGLITDSENVGLGLRGSVLTVSDGVTTYREEKVGVASPPTQVYVIETVSARAPTRDELLHAVVTHTKSAVRGQIDEAFGVVTGARAVRAWMQSRETDREQVDPGFFPSLSAGAGSLHRTLTHLDIASNQEAQSILDACDELLVLLSDDVQVDARTGESVSRIFDTLAERL